MTVSTSTPFADYVALLAFWIERHRDSVERLERTLLNVQGKPLSWSRNRSQFAALLDACFYVLPGLQPSASRLKGDLERRHRAAGFETTRRETFTHELDPLELTVRAYEYWDHTRWPGAGGRQSYARCLWLVVVLRHLEWLSLRIWDDGEASARDRLRTVQTLLDAANRTVAPFVLVRDAHWIMQTAQGPLTPHLGPYFAVADQITRTLVDPDHLEIHRAGAMMAGGHLRSQHRYGMWRSGRPFGDEEVMAFTRNSNSMDNALLVRDLIPLLEAYQRACGAGALDLRGRLAEAILQGLSADPELLLVRIDLIEPYTAIETLHVERGPDGALRRSPAGVAHADHVNRYRALISRAAPQLAGDALGVAPDGQPYSPFGVVYGFSADVLSNMVAAALVSPDRDALAFEDMFDGRDRLDDKAARARLWAALPTREGEREHFELSMDFAGQIHGRLLRALEARVVHGDAPNASGRRAARVYVNIPGAPGSADAAAGLTPQYCSTTDPTRAAAGLALLQSVAEFSFERQEGSFLASAENDGAWFGVSKLALTFGLEAGQDVVVADVPEPVLDVLRITCASLLAP
jgi:hypothetical protein